MKEPGAPSACKPDLITYSIMIKGYCKAKNIEQAFIILQEMEKVGIRADFALYKSLIIGCCKNNQSDMALKVYQNMRMLGIHSKNVYRLEKKSGTQKSQNDGGLSQNELRKTPLDPKDLSEFHEICKQATGSHTQWRKMNNFIM
jgi:pentatricopeptide repeat protein